MIQIRSNVVKEEHKKQNVETIYQYLTFLHLSLLVLL